MSASGIFYEAQQTLVASLDALDLAVVTDVRNARPMSVLVSPPTFTAFNDNIADIAFSVVILAAPPGNQDALDYLITTADTIMDSEISVLSGAPGMAAIGGQDVPTYDLTVRVSTARTEP
jgi:hypothetical protein